jgi:hypothetical protein
MWKSKESHIMEFDNPTLIYTTENIYQMYLDASVVVFLSFAADTNL